MRHLTIGPLDASVVGMVDGNELIVDWHIERVDNRRRLCLAIGHDLFEPFSERYGHTRGPVRRRIGPVRIAWYGKGVE